jgi:hypothetical protein
MYSLAGPLPKSPLPLFILDELIGRFLAKKPSLFLFYNLNVLMHFPSIYFGFLFESTLDRPEQKLN